LGILKKWNKVHNLTSVREDREIIRRHFLDSLSLVKCFKDLNIPIKDKIIADVGSGAGFPGVPLKIYYGDDIELILIESSAKKCAFLEYLKIHIGEDYEVVCERAENVSIKVDIAVARALGDLEYTEELLSKIGRGYIFIMKGREVEEVVKERFNIYRINMNYLPPLNILWRKLS